MKYFATGLVRRLTEEKDLMKPAERYRVGFIESWVSIAGNLILTLLKIIFGLLTNSIALIADAAHSASDIFSSLVVLIGFSLARRKPDPEHPHGHGRTEYLAGLLVGIMLIGAGAAFSYSSYIRLMEGIFATPSLAAIVAVVIAILTKEFLYHFSAELGMLINSEALTGDAWHHRSDSLSSALVLVALVGGYFGLPILDAYFGFAIALFIAYAGLKIVRNSCSRLLGTTIPEDLQERVVRCAREVDGVVDVHDLEAHDYGSWKVVTLHIGVNGRLSLDDAHRIAHKVEDHIYECCHCNAVVHLDPR